MKIGLYLINNNPRFPAWNVVDKENNVVVCFN